MASNHTETYQLNQWQLSDSIIMEEFNEDNRKTEAALLALKAAMPKVVTGSYVGTGTYGEENPTTLTFDFTPKLVIINGPAIMYAIYGAEKTYLRHTDHYGSIETVYLTWGENSLSWYHNESAQAQGNLTGSTYHYIAIG